MRKILFLDIDGVLHGDLNERLSRVGLFEAYLRQLPEVEIVFSSTWREDYTLDELRELFAAPLRAQVIGVTPILDEGCDRGGRSREIEAWLAAEGLDPDSVRWLALDDWPHLFDDRYPRLHLTDGKHGFTERDGEALLAWFGGR